MPIRSATIADIPAMMALDRAAPRAAHWSRQQYEIAVGSLDRIVLVIWADSMVEAFLIARGLGQEWELENIVTAAGCRRRGLGWRLLAEAIDLARLRKADAIFLEVRESNLAAKSLYEKCGFVLAGRRPQYYREPEENALVYRLTIP